MVTHCLVCLFCLCFRSVGAFGKYMAVSIVNDGPVTITLDSPAKKQEKECSKKGASDQSETVVAGGTTD